MLLLRCSSFVDGRNSSRASLLVWCWLCSCHFCPRPSLQKTTKTTKLKALVFIIICFFTQRTVLSSALSLFLSLRTRARTIYIHANIVRFYDPTTRLALVRVSRECCNQVRASITLIVGDETSTNQSSSSSSSYLRSQQQQRPVVAYSILAVRGTARLAKMDAIKYVRNHYRAAVTDQIRRQKRQQQQSLPLPAAAGTRKGGLPMSWKQVEKDCREITETINELANIDF
jgi:hypothetical protein